jgi:hypothetical protein
MIAGYSNCDTFPLTALGSLQTFALLPPVLNQSFTNGSNADKAPFLNLFTVQPATRLSSSLCAEGVWKEDKSAIVFVWAGGCR